MSNTIHAVGRRKTSVARVYVKPGQGKIVINKRDIDAYYIRATSKMIINQPLELTGNEGKLDILVNVTGGGLTGTALSVMLSVDSYGAILKTAEFLSLTDLSLVM